MLGQTSPKNLVAWSDQVQVVRPTLRTLVAWSDQVPLVRPAIRNLMHGQTKYNRSDQPSEISCLVRPDVRWSDRVLTSKLDQVDKLVEPCLGPTVDMVGPKGLVWTGS